MSNHNDYNNYNNHNNHNNNHHLSNNFSLAPNGGDDLKREEREREWEKEKRFGLFQNAFGLSQNEISRLICSGEERESLRFFSLIYLFIIYFLSNLIPPL